MQMDDNDTTIQVGCINCIQAIEVHASYSDDRWFVAPSARMWWPDWQHDTTSTVRKHLVNIPLLGFFFKNETLKMLRGDVFSDNEPKVAIPRFRYFETKSSKLLA